MTKPDLDAIKARAEAATPWPWRAHGDAVVNLVRSCTCAGHIPGHGHEPFCGIEGPVATGAEPFDANFIAHAREDIPALLAEVQELRELVTDLNKQLDAKRQHDALGEDEDCGVCNHLAFDSLSEAYDELLEEGEQLRAKIEAARKAHRPIEALNTRVNKFQQVCSGCGTDAGDWETWPCPTIRALGVE